MQYFAFAAFDVAEITGFDHNNVIQLLPYSIQVSYSASVCAGERKSAQEIYGAILVNCIFFFISEYMPIECKKKGWIATTTNQWQQSMRKRLCTPFLFLLFLSLHTHTLTRIESMWLIVQLNVMIKRDLK